MNQILGNGVELNEDAPVDLLQSGSANHLVLSSEGVVIEHFYNPEYIGKNGGVPQVLFQISNNISGTVQSESGRILEYTIKPNSVRIADLEDPRFHLKADVEHGELSLSVYTKIDGFRHPDLFATELLKVICEWFKLQGHPVQYINDLWIDGDNLEAYWRGIDLNGSCECAALVTWTGQFAQNVLGLDSVFVEEVRATKIKAFFFKKEEDENEL